MNSRMEVIGPESGVMCYNLNKQFCNVNKIVITSDIVLGAFEEDSVKETFNHLSTVHKDSYAEEVSRILDSSALDSPINNQLYQTIQEKLSSISQNAMDIQLKDYNFMNSVSNSKFNVVLRTDSFSISRFYVEKGAILSNIRSLLRDYVKFSGNAFRTSKFAKFQIEIFESEETYKRVFLKKDGSSLVLSSYFGFPQTFPVDFQSGSELYFSKGENFNFYKNNQASAILRDHTKLDEKEINEQEKILSDDELVLINNNTKNISDALIELELTKKGHLRIISLNLLDNSLDGGYEEGFFLNKSNKSYDKISLVTLRDNLGEEMPNPRYLLVRNSGEVKELISDLKLLGKVDGLVFNENFYMPFLDTLSEMLDIDIIYAQNPLNKSLEVSLDVTNSRISLGEEISTVNMNPFSNIISEQNKSKDEFLERLRNIDLNSPSSQQNNSEVSSPQSSSSFHQERSSIDNIAQSIISSPNSSTAKVNSTGVGWGDSPSLNSLSSNREGSGKGAIGMLADAVLRNDSKPIKEEFNSAEEVQGDFTSGFGAYEDKSSSISETHHDLLNRAEHRMDIGESSLVENQNNSPVNSQSSDFGFGDLGQSNQESSGFPQQNQTVNNTFSSGVPSSNSVSSKEIVFITSPEIESGCYFADSNNLSQVMGGEIYFLTSDVNNLNNPNINYVLPVSMQNDSLMGHYFIINNINDFFIANDSEKVFANLSYVDEQIKEGFLSKAVSLFENCFIIASKNDVDLLVRFKDKIGGLFIKDLTSIDEFNMIKSKFGSISSNSNSQTNTGGGFGSGLLY